MFYCFNKLLEPVDLFVELFHRIRTTVKKDLLCILVNFSGRILIYPTLFKFQKGENISQHFFLAKVKAQLNRSKGFAPDKFSCESQCRYITLNGPNHLLT